MKIYFIRITITYKLLVIPLVIIVLLSCNFNGNENFATGKKSVTNFDHFSYNGFEDFYKENPLPGNGNSCNPILPGSHTDSGFCSNGKSKFILLSSTFFYPPGFPIFHSTDLVNWKQTGQIFNRKTQLPLDKQQKSAGIFALAIRHKPLYDAKYYKITTNVGAGNFIAKTENPSEIMSVADLQAGTIIPKSKHIRLKTIYASTINTINYRNIKKIWET